MAAIVLLLIMSQEWLLSPLLHHQWNVTTQNFANINSHVTCPFRTLYALHFIHKFQTHILTNARNNVSVGLLKYGFLSSFHSQTPVQFVMGSSFTHSLIVLKVYTALCFMVGKLKAKNKQNQHYLLCYKSTPLWLHVFDAGCCQCPTRSGTDGADAAWLPS